jgi:hypothetical protein
VPGVEVFGGRLVLQVGRICDRALLELRLLDPGQLVEPVLRDDRARSALGQKAAGHEHLRPI